MWKPNKILSHICSGRIPMSEVVWVVNHLTLIQISDLLFVATTIHGFRKNHTMKGPSSSVNRSNHRLRSMDSANQNITPSILGTSLQHTHDTHLRQIRPTRKREVGKNQTKSNESTQIPAHNTAYVRAGEYIQGGSVLTLILLPQIRTRGHSGQIVAPASYPWQGDEWLNELSYVQRYMGLSKQNLIPHQHNLLPPAAGFF